MYSKAINSPETSDSIKNVFIKALLVIIWIVFWVVETIFRALFVIGAAYLILADLDKGLLIPWWLTIILAVLILGIFAQRDLSSKE